MPNEVMKLAYDAACGSLKEQDSTLGSLRNRATGLLAAASVGTSFAAAAGLINTDPAKGAVFPSWATWVLLVLVIIIGASVMYVLWPLSEWSFGPSSATLLAVADTDINDVMRAATHGMNNDIESNNRTLDMRMRVYRLAVVALLAETIALLITLVVQPR